MFRSTPPVTKNLIIINVLAFFAKYVLVRYGIDLESLMGLHFFMARDFALYQLVTYMFMHANFEHIFFNMFALWMFGSVVEYTWGQRKFLLFFFVCGIGAGLTQEAWQLGQYYIEGMQNYSVVTDGAVTMSMADYLNTWTTVGASGACYAVMLAFAMTYPNETLVLFPIPIPIKAKYFVMVCIVIEVVSSFATNSNVAHFAHLGGMAFAYFFIRYNNRHRSGFDGWDNYGSGGNSLFDRMRRHMSRDDSRRYGEHSQDIRYNEERNERQREIDRILDKIRRSGYESLTDDEKRKLFEAGEK